VYKSDFIAEREARSRLATEKDRLRQELEAEQLKNQGLADQLTRYTQQQLQDMQLRASQADPYGRYHYPQGQYSHPYPQVTVAPSTRDTNYPQQGGPYHGVGAGGDNSGGAAALNRGAGVRGSGGDLNDLSEGGGVGVGGQGAGV